MLPPIPGRARIILATIPVAVLLSVSGLSSASAADSASPAPMADLIERFLSRDDPPPASYRAVRRLSARNSRFKMDGWIEVETTLTGGSALRWAVLEEGGSGTIRNRVLRKALAGEAELLAKREGARGAFTLANYDFAVAGNGRIDLRPKRKDTLLISGFVLLAEEDADLLEVSGQLTKNPSFWTRNVRVQRRYARINGVRVPVETTSMADVRFAGQSHFEMTYRYLEVNGEPVRAAVSQDLARKLAAHRYRTVTHSSCACID